METIGSRLQALEQDPMATSELEALESVVEVAQKKTPFDVTQVLLTNLGDNIAADINLGSSAKTVRMNTKMEAVNDGEFMTHALIHEGVHHDFGNPLLSNDINEAVTEVIAGERSGQGAQTYESERQELMHLAHQSGKNIVQLYKHRQFSEINKIIATNDDDYTLVA